MTTPALQIVSEYVSECRHCNHTIYFNGHNWRHIGGDFKGCRIYHEKAGDAAGETIFRVFKWFKVREVKVESWECLNCGQEVFWDGWSLVSVSQREGGKADCATIHCGLTAAPKPPLHGAVNWRDIGG